jgi:spore coat protein CotH
MGGSNVLATRFLADPAFKALYEEKLQEVYEVAFLDGTIAQVVEGYAALVREANAARSLVALEDYEAAVANVLDFVAQRGEYLAATPLFSGQAAQAG